MKLFILLSMFFLHIIDDFVLQGAWLSNGKQRSWWIKNAPDVQYRHDYLMALFIHAFSWSFMIMLPIAVYLHFEVDQMFLIDFICNVFIHAIIDNLKANYHWINLITDQAFHFLQIFVTFLTFLY